MTTSKVALVVDDEAVTARTTARLLRMRFATVLTATTPAEAEAILKSEPVTHLLCDHDLGRDLPTGAELIPRWRVEFPTITRAVIYSGSTREEIDLPSQVDLFLGKPVGMIELFEAFEVKV